MKALSAACRDERLFERYRDPSDHVDLDAMTRRFMPLARGLAGRFASGRAPYDDLLQVASLELLRAIDRFDPGRRVAFSSYAMPAMTGAIKRYYRDVTWAVRVPRDLKELALAVDDTRARLTRDLGRAPADREVADAVRVSEQEVMEAQLALEASTNASLDVLGDEDTRRRDVPEALRYDDRGYERVEQRAVLDALLSQLSHREREVLRLRFEDDLRQRDIAERVGISQMQVSRILRAALAALTEIAEPRSDATDAPALRRTPAAAAR